MANYGNGANYSKLSTDLICTNCKHGHIVESPNGKSAIFCLYGGDYPGEARRMHFIISRCNRHEKEEVTRIWDDATTIKLEEGHAWVPNQAYFPTWGYMDVRADTLKREDYLWIVRGGPSESTSQFYNNRTKKWIRNDELWKELNPDADNAIDQYSELDL